MQWNGIVILLNEYIVRLILEYTVAYLKKPKV